MTPVVSALRIAPVKGLSSVLCDAVHIDHHGVAEDRRVFLLDDHGDVVTLRPHPELVTVVPGLDLENGVLSVALPGGATASTPLAGVAEQVTAHLYGKDRSGRILPGAVADALSEVAGERLRVVLADVTGVGWDEGPVSLLGRASAEAIGGSRDTARYRMLVELDGTEPFEEDSWVGRELALGQARVRVAYPLQRCVVITHSPDTGQKDWDGLHALAEKRGPDMLCLGVIAEVLTPGTVTVGAAVEVLG
jgi:uncharacterized protein YcbX